MKFSISIFLPVLLATYVSAHGMILRSKVGNGKVTSRSDRDSFIRSVSSQDPNLGANTAAITCGPNAKAAPSSAEAQPGDVMTFDWRTASDGAWPHNIGPVITYMASCGPVTCDQFNPAQADWFKIDEKGRKPNSNEWFQNDLKNGGVATATIPQNLAPGNYMVRNEIIALHLATNQGGAEFYPGCIQVKVGGSGTGSPSPAELVKLPGAYSDNDKGIFAPQVFNAAVAYQMPGPAISRLAGTAAPAPAPGTSVPGAPNAPAPGAPNAPGAPSASGVPKPTGAASPPAAGAPTGAPTGSPRADAPAAAPTHAHDDGSCGRPGKKGPKQRRNVSRQPAPVDDVADEVPGIDITQIRKVAAALPGLEGVKPRHINSRIARRMAFEASLH